MNKPIVAIVGRPNVGKSTLFNRLTGHRTAIVEGEPSITRDRLYSEVRWLDKYFIVVDTGGLEPDNDNFIKNQVRYQAETAMEEAELILFVVDGRTGITALDREVAQLLRKTNKKIILVLNKIEDFSAIDEVIWEFYALGFDEPIPISAEHGKNTGDLLDKVVKYLPEVKEQEKDLAINIAIVGKPNVGKSSFVNYIVGNERVIVSEEPGTTRDAIDTLVEVGNTKFNLIDTAGLRRKSRVKESIEYYSNLRSIRAIERSDGVLMMVDACEGVTEQDKKIAGYAHNNGKAIVLAINKWDLMEKDQDLMNSYREEVYYRLKFLSYAPLTFISSLKGIRIDESLNLLEYAVDQNARRVKTGVLNEVIQESVQLREPPSRKGGKRLKVYYASQIGIKPPKIVLSVNNPALMHFAYKRYLENSIRNAFGFIGTPINIKIKKRS